MKLKLSCDKGFNGKICALRLFCLIFVLRNQCLDVSGPKKETLL